MLENNALILLQQYMQGWETHQLSQILGSLADNCLIIESHGPTFSGLDEVNTWFQTWLTQGNSVKKWVLQSFYFCETKNTAFAEWFFQYETPQGLHDLTGASVVTYNEDKVLTITEYMRTL